LQPTNCIQFLACLKIALKTLNLYPSEIFVIKILSITATGWPQSQEPKFQLSSLNFSWAFCRRDIYYFFVWSINLQRSMESKPCVISKFSSQIDYVGMSITRVIYYPGIESKIFNYPGTRVPDSGNTIFQEMAKFPIKQWTLLKNSTFWGK
jgi:hypothetical protein